jgi:hypothetical protein
MRRDAEPSSDVLRAHSPLVGQSRDKLVSIPVFAWCCATFCQGQDWVASLQAWQLMRRLSFTAKNAFDTSPNGRGKGNYARLSLMGRFSARPTLTFFGWAGTALMAVTVVALIWSSIG